MKAPFLVILPMLVAFALQAACSRQTEQAASTEPRVEGDRVVFPGQAPQLERLVCAPAKPAQGLRHRVTGHLVWNEEDTVRVYSPLGGRVGSILVQLGDRVEKGAALASLESPDFGQVQADAHRAKADLIMARKALDRANDLFSHGAIAQKDLESAEDSYAAAEAEGKRTAARLALYDSSNADSVDQLFVLRTPISGVVVERNMNPGQEIRPDMMLANAPQLLAPQFVVSNPRRLGVLLDLTELEAGLVHKGQRFAILSRAYPEKRFEGTLDVVGTSLDPVTRTVKTHGVVENPELQLKAEMYVDVELEREADVGAVQISNAGVFLVNNKSYVFVNKGAGSFERREVHVFSEEDGVTCISSGLKEGESVLVQGSLLLETLLESGGRS